MNKLLFAFSLAAVLVGCGSGGVDQSDPKAVTAAYFNAYACGDAETQLKLIRGFDERESQVMRDIAALFKEGKQFSAKVVSNDVRLEKKGDYTTGFMMLEVNGEKKEMWARMKMFDGKWFVVK